VHIVRIITKREEGSRSALFQLSALRGNGIYDLAWAADDDVRCLEMEQKLLPTEKKCQI